MDRCSRALEVKDIEYCQKHVGNGMCPCIMYVKPKEPYISSKEQQVSPEEVDRLKHEMATLYFAE